MILDVDLETWKEFRFSEPLQLFCEHRSSGLVVPDKEIKNVNSGYSYMIIKTKWSVSEALRKLQGTLRATPCFVHVPAPTEPIQLLCDCRFASEELTNHFRLNSHFRKCKGKNRLLDWRLPMGTDYIFWLWKSVPSSFLVQSISRKYLMHVYWVELNCKMKMKQMVPNYTNLLR